MNRPLCAMVLLLALMPVVAAAPCRARFCRPVVFARPVVAVKAVKVVKVVPIVESVATFFAVPLVAPVALAAVPPAVVPPAAYGAGGTAYGAGGAAAGGAAGAGGWQGPTQQEWRSMLEAVQYLLRAEQQRSGAGPRGAAGPEAKPQAAAPAPAAGKATNTEAKCAACHDRSVAATKGGKHVFLDGGQITATAKERLRMVDAVIKGRMPRVNDKAAPLDDAAAQQVIDELTK